MALTCGIVGLPNVGKSTLFNALTAAGAAASNYPFCTIDKNVGKVPIPDERLNQLARILKPEKITPTTIEFVDIAGLVRGASQGEGLGNQFLSHIREVDAVVEVVRCFEDEAVTHVDGSMNAQRDLETIATELCLADLETVEKRLEKAQKAAKSGDKKLREDVSFLTGLLEGLQKGIPIRKTLTSPDDKKKIKDLHLLSEKAVMVVCNVSEGDIGKPNEAVEAVKRAVENENIPVLEVSAKVEAELLDLPVEERGSFLSELGLSQSGLVRVIHAAYELLGLITFFTVQSNQCQAWTVVRGTKAPQAAGVIHTDFERGFICAEVMALNDLQKLGSEAEVKTKGLGHTHGKEYVVQDGDVIRFRFNV